MRRLDSSASRRWLALAAGAAFVLAGPPVLAADAAATAKTPAGNAKPREASLGKGTGPLLTREQLRQCVAEQGRLKQEGADTLQAQRGLDKDRAEIDRLGAELDAAKTSLDRTSQAAVDAYNELARTRDRMIGDYQAAVPAFNLRVGQLDAAKESYTKECADRKYFEDDYNAIKAGK